MDLNGTLIYLGSLIAVATFFGILMLLNKLLEDKLVNFIKKFYTKIKTHHDINSIKIQEIITNINSDLASLRAECGADRTCIYEFHNGSEFSSKFPQWKITNTYERVKPGIPYGKDRFSNIPATLIWENFLEFIFIDNKKDFPLGIQIHDTNLKCKAEGCIFPRKVLKYFISEMPFCNIKTMSEQQGIEVVLFTPIVNIHGNIIGIISVEYNHIEDYLENENKINPCILCNFAANISLIWQLEGESFHK